MGDKYEVLAKIGKGSFGIVDKCRDKVTNDIVARKLIYFEELDEGVPSSVIREVSLLKELEHGNIVRLLDIINNAHGVELVFEYVELDLRKIIDLHPQNLNPYTIKSFLRQILSGVAFCHAHKILHRDMKPQNLLVDSEKKTLKLADFGLAKEFSVPIRSHTEQVGTMGYHAPEQLLGCTRYSAQIDVWAVGCIFAEMVTKKPLFGGVLESHVLFEICRLIGVPDEITWPGVSRLPGYYSLPQVPNDAKKNLEDVVPGIGPDGFQLLSRMLTLNPATRISAHEALREEYFKNL